MLYSLLRVEHDYALLSSSSIRATVLCITNAACHKINGISNLASLPASMTFPTNIILIAVTGCALTCPTACCHMSSRRVVKRPHGALSPVPAACCHVSPLHAVTFLRSVLSHVPVAYCHMPTCPHSMLSRVTAAFFRASQERAVTSLPATCCHMSVRCVLSLLSHDVPRRAVTCLREPFRTIKHTNSLEWSSILKVLHRGSANG